MARPSKLSEQQWSEITRRLVAGERAADLAREYGVSKSALSTRVSKRAETINTVANQIVTVEKALGSLPVSEQLIAVSLASKLRSISDNLASAAMLGAATAHRLQALANSEVAKIDDATPLESAESLKGVMVLTRLANDSASIALNLIAANKDTVKKMNEDPPPESTLDPSKLSSNTLHELLEARG